MRVGVLGGGQLGAMLALAGFPLGLEFIFLDPNPDSPAFKLGESICADYTVESVSQLAAACDVVTFEFENVPADVLQKLENTNISPSARALLVSQDRLTEKNFLQSLGITTAAFVEVTDSNSVKEAFKDLKLKAAIIKSRRFGYDGKSQIRVTESQLDNNSELEHLLQTPCILEAPVPFQREISQISTRSPSGTIIHFPLTENVHKNGILKESFSPPRAPLNSSTVAHAREYAEKVVKELNYVGTITLELFDTPTGLVANELAPRVHNSGHWTIDGSTISQFEAHLRALCGFPLSTPHIHGHSYMVNILGTYPEDISWLESPYVKLHRYHKGERTGRKIGHITVCAPTSEALQETVAKLQLSGSCTSET
jgi:5-(carboxyamino)imidazole ribonucleotide synthase